jgi:dsRNA-specific ribonuclease
MHQLNVKNKLICEQHLRELVGKICPSISERINYTSLVQHSQIALTHDSYTYANNGGDGYKNIFTSTTNCVPFQHESYQIYETIGDSLLKSFITLYIINLDKDKISKYLHNSLNAGSITVIRSKMEKTMALANFTKQLNFVDYILIGKTLDDNNERMNDNLHEDVFEAFVYAMFQSITPATNWQDTYTFVHCIFDRYFDWDIAMSDINYRSILSEYSIKVLKSHCKFVETSTDGQPNLFTITIKHPTTQIILGVATDRRKIDAYQASARIALQTLHLLEMNVPPTFENRIIYKDKLDERENKYKKI